MAARLDEVPERELAARVARALDAWPSAGLAVALVGRGSGGRLLARGVADVRTREPVTGDTVFRVGSLTKTFTAIAVLQLAERGLVDLDAPAGAYLRAIRLVPARAGLRPPTVRHLLTHTAGIGYWRRLSDLLRPGVGSGVRAGRGGAPPLAEYYRRGLPVVIAPGTRWVYSNHGFAALGQLVRDVTGVPLHRHLREHVFEPLGMDRTDLVRSGRVARGLATGYALRARGLREVADREIPTPGGGGAYSTAADMARYLAALLAGGTGARGAVLRPETLAGAFEPHFRLDPRTAGMGLGFEPGEEGGHRTVGKTGVLSGFGSAMILAPDAGLGVVALANTGGLDGRSAAAPLADALARLLLGLPDRAVREDLPPRPESWAAICGWYGLAPGPVTNLFMRALWGAGAEVAVRGGHLALRPLAPSAAMRRWMRLHPDDPGDPWVFRVEPPGYGRTLRVVFVAGREGGAAARMLLDVIALERRPDALNPRRLAAAGLVAGAAALAIGGGRGGSPSPRPRP